MSKVHKEVVHYTKRDFDHNEKGYTEARCSQGVRGRLVRLWRDVDCKDCLKHKPRKVKK